MSKAACLITGIFCIAFAAGAQVGPGQLTLHSVDDACAVAVKNNPTKHLYDLNVQKANIDYKTAKSFLYPSVTASATGQDNLKIAVTPVPGEIVNQPGKTLFLKFGKQYVYNGGITIARSIFNWQAMAQARVAENNISLNQAEADAYVQVLKQQTAQYYYTALVAKASVALSLKDIAAADTIVKITQQRLAEGLTDATAVNGALINYNQVLANKLQSQQLLDESLQSLHVLLGMPTNDSLVLTQQLGLQAFEDVATLNLGIDKNLQVYPHQLKAAELNTKVQKMAYAPQIGVSSYLGKQQFRDDFGLGFGSGAWSNYQYIGLSVSVPIFTGFATQNKIRSAEISKSIAEEQYRAAKQQASASDSIVLLRLASYKAVCKASADNFGLYYNNCELAKQKFDEGLVSADVYLKGFQDYLVAENTHLNNLAALFSNYAVILSRQ